jgi:hypothetical protein
VKLRGVGVKKLTVIIALCCSLACSPTQAKTFVGVLWPMFGPTAAPGLVELVAELKMMPDVEVSTYLHQSWPYLVEEIERQAPGTHTIVVGYSLGANSSVFVANKAKYVDLIIALQPSMLSWNPPVTGKVGRIIEIYNPNPWMTFGGMGSKKLIGDNIEYITNYDSHPGAQFSSEFRSLVKGEIAKFNSSAPLQQAKAETPPNQRSQLPGSSGSKSAEKRQTNPQADSTASAVQAAQTGVPQGTKPAKPEHVADRAVQTAQTGVPQGTKPAKPEHVAERAVQTAQTGVPQGTKPAKPEHVAEEAPKQLQGEATALLDQLTGSINSGNLLVQRRLTVSDMRDYAQRTYHGSHTDESITTASLDAVVGVALSQQQGSDFRKAE